MKFKEKHFHYHGGDYHFHCNYHDARSTVDTNHYHGTSFFIFQFPSLASPGDMISCPDEIPTTSKSSDSKNADSFPHHTQKFEDSFYHLLHLHF